MLDGNRRIVSTLEFQGGVLPTAGTRTHLHPPPALPGHTGTSVLSVETRSPGASLCNPKHHHKRDGSGCRRGVVKQPHAVPRGLAACRGRRRQAGRQAAQADASNSRGEHAGKGRHEDGHELQLHPVRMAPHGARTVFKGHGVHRPLLHLGHSLLHPERSPGAQSPPHGIAKCQSVREKPSPQDPSGKSPVADGVCCLNTTEDRLSLPLPAVLAQSSGSAASDPAA